MINNYEYDKDLIKNSISAEDMIELLGDLGGEPETLNGAIVSKTICHCGQSHKLWYYPNTGLFHCYTDCSDTFDVFDLIRRVKSHSEEGYDLPKAVRFVAQRFGFSPKDDTAAALDIAEDWKLLNQYDRIKNISKTTQKIELKTYDDRILRNLPKPRIIDWEEEGITRDVMNRYEICYNPKSQAIVIPHRDDKGRLVGIRERALIQENADLYGKYRPAYINGQLYNHPLSFSLYGLDKNKYNIARTEKAIVFEGEKSVLIYDSYFGSGNNIAVAACGSNLINYQTELLKQAGAKEIIVAFDRQFKDNGDDEFKKLTKNLEGISRKYGNNLNISFIFDRDKTTDYKASPIDEGKEKFINLFKERVNLYS